MVNQNETHLIKMDYYRQRALNQSNRTNEIQEQMTNSNIDSLIINRSNNLLINKPEIDLPYQNLLSSSFRRNFFKDYKLVLNEIMNKIESDQLNKLEHPSIINFKKESIKLINTYIDTASIEHNQALELSEQRSKCRSNEINRRINLFTDLQYDCEELEADLIEYLGY